MADFQISHSGRAALESDLRKRLEGEVRFDEGSRALYAADASNYRQIPIGVVIPKTVDDVIATVATAREHGVPMLSRGGGTSIAGQCVNVALLMDFSKYLNKIIEIDPDKRLARVQPGLVLDDLRTEAEKHGLTFGPDPATHRWCTLGGMIGNNSCGVHSVMAGRTVDNVHGLHVLQYDGTLLNVGLDFVEGGRPELVEKLRTLVNTNADEIRRTFPQIPRRVSGYSIDQLLPENGFHVARSLVGSEGTLITLLEATVNLLPSPPKRVLLVAGYDDISQAGDAVPALLVAKGQPNGALIGLEGLDRKFIADMRKKHLHEKQLNFMPKGEGWLLAEFGADSTAAAKDAAERMADELRKNSPLLDYKVYDDPQDQKAIWTVRDSGLGATARIPGEKDNWEGWEDAAVPPEKVGPYLRDFRKLLDKFQYHGSVYGHIGDGCVHTRLDWDPKSKEGIDKWVRFVNEAANLVLSYGGSLSGEHGDGQSRAELLPKMFGPKIIQAFEEFKTIWDPDWKMNPGKIVRPYRIDENLRYGANYNPIPLQTYFQYPEDNGSFARATERCVGAGVCRKEHDGIMCPSYMATREEQHVTRGRTHLLFEMMRGGITEGWQSDAIRDALDLCLACKGCRSECPVRVDVATYKAEFLAHYYENKPRPRAAHTMGKIYNAAKFASRVPSIVNWLTHAPIFSDIAKRIGGIHPKREIPRFAKQSFKKWYRSRAASAEKTSRNKTAANAKEVILWADTFNNYFRPDTAKAALEVLEDAGFKVKVIGRSVCCGRPLYDWGMLKEAREHLEEILKVLKNDIIQGTPIVVLEPSCASVFKDELHNLMPTREDAKKLAEHTYLLLQFLEKFAPDYAPKINKDAVMHLHCHHRSVFGDGEGSTLLDHAGINADVVNAGCCGMAGAFGFEEEHYDISLQIGERRLLPKVRETPTDHLIIADGFSCREQIEQTTGRKTLHFAEVLRLNKNEKASH